MSNSLDRGQDRQNVDPDLDPNSFAKAINRHQKSPLAVKKLSSALIILSLVLTSQPP